MKSSLVEIKRARPALGTVITIRVKAIAESERIDQTMTDVFELIEDLEDKFSKFRALSDVMRLNQAAIGREIPVSEAFYRLLPRATEFWRLSNAAFNPFETSNLEVVPIKTDRDGSQYYAEKTAECTLDLSGIAKGFVVDEVVRRLSECEEIESGVVSAGGDLCFFNTTDRSVEIRLNTPGKMRSIEINQSAVATSSLAELSEDSSTVYTATPRFDKSFTVSVVAKDCTTADALTKVGWFGTLQDLRNCEENLNVQFLILDESGNEAV